MLDSWPNRKQLRKDMFKHYLKFFLDRFTTLTLIIAPVYLLTLGFLVRAGVTNSIINIAILLLCYGLGLFICALINRLTGSKTWL